MEEAKPRILVLCTGNSARSQMAEAYLKKFGGGQFLVESAGLEAGTLNPVAVEVMMEEGIDISGKQTHDVFKFFKEGRKYDYVITVCEKSAAELCPVFPGVHQKIMWSFKDPSALTGSYEDKLAVARTIRDQIKNAVLQFIKGMTI